MITSNGYGHDIGPSYLVEEIFDHLNRPVFAHRIDRRIADIRYVADLKGFYAAGWMDPADQTRHFPYAGRPMPSTRAVVEAQIERNPHQSHIHLWRDGMADRTHEGGDTGEARRDRGIKWLKRVSIAHLTGLQIRP